MATWYTTGTVSVSNGSTTVTGSGTSWVANTKPGEAFRGPDDRLYEIEAVVSDTSLTLADDYLGSNQSGQAYAILPVRGVLKQAYDALTSAIATMNSYIGTALSGLFENGSVGAPGIGFTSDPDTGLYRPGANELAITVGGSRRMQLQNTSSLVQFWPNGTARTFWLDDSSVRADVPIYVQATDVFDPGPSITTGTKTTLHLDAADAGAGAEGRLGAMVTFSRAMGGSNRRKAGFGAIQVGSDEDSTGLAFLTYSGTSTSNDQLNTRGVIRGNDLLMRGDLYANTDVETWPVVLGDRLLHEGDAQDTPDDTTANKLMKVGAGGWLGNGADITSSGDYDTSYGTISQIIGNVTGSNLPANAPIATGFSGIQSFPTGGRGMQLVVRSQGAGSGSKTTLYARGYDGDFGEWTKLYTDANAVGVVTEAEDGAIIERGSNSNGEYVKFMDGTMIATIEKVIDVTDGTPQSFTLPATFSPAQGAAVSHTANNPNPAIELTNIAAVRATAVGVTLKLASTGTVDADPLNDILRIVVFGRWK